MGTASEHPPIEKLEFEMLMFMSCTGVALAQ